MLQPKHSAQTSAAQTAVAELQQRISEMQPQRLGERALPTHPGLAPLLPGGSLRQGASYAVLGSRSLALATVAEASASGSWCGVIGCDTLGAEAAAALGVALDRCVLVPRPGPHALGFAASLAEVLEVVVLALPEGAARVSAGEVERIAAKLREHGTALVVTGAWPHVEAELSVVGTRWHGLGEGRGLLDSCELAVQSRDRRGTRQHTVRFAGGALLDPTHAPVRRLPVHRLSERRLVPR